MELLVLVLLIGIGPLALLLGVDSREDDARGWWPGARSWPRPGLREPRPTRREQTTANRGRLLADPGCTRDPTLPGSRVR
jgi:hypothetical protein